MTNDSNKVQTPTRTEHFKTIDRSDVHFWCDYTAFLSLRHHILMSALIEMVCCSAWSWKFKTCRPHGAVKSAAIQHTKLFLMSWFWGCKLTPAIAYIVKLKILQTYLSAGWKMTKFTCRFHYFISKCLLEFHNVFLPLFQTLTPHDQHVRRPFFPTIKHNYLQPLWPQRASNTGALSGLMQTVCEHHLCCI